MADHQLPPLNALRAFEAAARLGSFAAAAEELRVTHPIVGRHVRGLEARLKVSLFQKSGRGVVLTAEGRRYLARISRAFAEIADATYELAPKQTSRWMRLVVSPGLSSRWLATRLPKLSKSAPMFNFVLEPGGNFNSVYDGSADIGIGYGQAAQFPGDVKLLSSPQVFPVCSPAFLQNHEPVGSLRELAKSALIHEDEGTWWSDWFLSLGFSFKMRGRISFTNAAQVIDVALAGHGIALVNAFLVHRELELGTLVRATNFSTQLEGYYIIMRPGRKSPHVKSFEHWLREEVAEFDRTVIQGLNILPART